MPRLNVIHIMGGTCTGKTTLVDTLAKRPSVHAIFVGRMLRAKYGPDYFKGQAAPAHTQVEAWAIYWQGLQEAQASNKSIVLVDGQPRDIGSVDKTLKEARLQNAKPTFVLLHADFNVREDRARKGRQPGPDLNLALARLYDDYATCYTILTELAQAGIVPFVIDTSKITPEAVVAELDGLVDWPDELR